MKKTQNKHDMNNYYDEAIQQLSKVTNVKEWNKVRAYFVDVLTQEELAKIDSEGLIIKVLGPDKIYK